MAVRCAHKSCDTGLELTKSLRCTENGAPANAGIEASMHSAGMHMRQMQILLSGGKSAADMALGLVDIENVTRFCGKLRVYAKQPVSIRDILVHSGFADAKLLCSLTHRGIDFQLCSWRFPPPLSQYMISKNTPAYSVVTVYAGVFLILHTGCNSIYVFRKIRKRFLNRWKDVS